VGGVLPVKGINGRLPPCTFSRFPSHADGRWSVVRESLALVPCGTPGALPCPEVEGAPDEACFIGSSRHASAPGGADSFVARAVLSARTVEDAVLALEWRAEVVSQRMRAAEEQRRAQPQRGGAHFPHAAAHVSLRVAMSALTTMGTQPTSRTSGNHAQYRPPCIGATASANAPASPPSTGRREILRWPRRLATTIQRLAAAEKTKNRPHKTARMTRAILMAEVILEAGPGGC